jgi:hypothetical protein
MRVLEELLVGGVPLRVLALVDSEVGAWAVERGVRMDVAAL